MSHEVTITRARLHGNAMYLGEVSCRGFREMAGGMRIP